MAKFGMKDYENFLKEEERQDSLQERLEAKNRENTAINEEWKKKQNEKQQSLENELMQYCCASWGELD